MAKKPITFSGNQLIISSRTPFKISDFNSIKAREENIDVVEISKDKKETLGILVTEKKTVDGRFVTVYFNDGDKYPYVDKVKKNTNGHVEELDNPRDPEEIEMRGQFFVVIDTTAQRIWLSDQRKKKMVAAWLKEKLGEEIEIKAIIQEANLLERLEDVSEIAFSAVPSIFNQIGSDTLSSKLVEDIYGFDAEKVRVQLSYSNKKLTDKIRKKLYEIINKKEDFDEICVVGRSDEDFETIFNTEGIVSKLLITVPLIKETQQFDDGEVFQEITRQIKSHDK